MPAVGIGVVTFNRRDHLRSCVERLRQLTLGEARIVVADDGSTDGTRAWCEEEGITVVGRRNRGVCWNKNRALFALQAMGCDPVLLLEDDCWPRDRGWDVHWRVATALFGHVSFAHEKLQPWTLSGSGTALDPIVNNKATAQCSSISARLLRKVGFFDTRFQGYGVGHAEWTTRIKRTGAGFKMAELPDGRRARANLYILGGVEAQDAPSFRDNSNVRRNEELFDRIKEEPVYRHPWTTEEEKADFLAEMEEDGIATEPYLTAAGAAPGTARHLAAAPALTGALDALLAEEGGAPSLSGWLAGVASGVAAMPGRLLPVLPMPLGELLADRVRPPVRVLTVGAGLGALWWAERAGAVTAIEQEEQWVTLLPALAGPQRISVVHRKSDAFPQAAAELKVPPGIVVLDSPERASTLFALLPKLPADGVVVCRQMQRREAGMFAATLARAGCRELRLSGPLPTGTAVEAASVFYRDGNLLGI